MLYKDLTPEQQEHLHDTFSFCGEFPEDATHIDEGVGISKENLLKFTGNTEYYMSHRYNKWIEASNNLNRAEAYFKIPTDFCRVTGEVLSDADDTEPTFPDFPFKLSCGDRPEVRQWLKDNGCKWNSGDNLFVNWSLSKKYILIETDKTVTHVVENNYSRKYNEYFEIVSNLRLRILRMLWREIYNG